MASKNVHRTLSEDDLKALARLAGPKSFWAFCVYWDFDFFYKRRRFLKEVADMLQFVADCYSLGEAVRVAVSMPPRSGKSYIVTLFCAWWLGRFNIDAILRCTGTAALYMKFSRDCRAIVSDPRFRAVFPAVRLHPQNRGVTQWSLRTSKQTAYFGNGVGGSIIGFGASLGILDDLYPDMLRALSTTYVERVNSWMDSAFDSRLEKGAPVIYCGTRWTDGDMIARAMERGLDKQLSIPALTAEGVSFCEDVKTTREYLDIRKSLRLDENTDGYTWLAEYMQQPLRVEGYLYPCEGLHYYEEIPEEARLLERVCFVDPADEGADGFTAVWCDIRSLDGYPAVYVVDTFNTSGEGVEAGSARVADRCRQHGTETCMVEVNGVGRAAYLLLRSQAGDTRVKGYQEHTAKDVRILSTFEHVRRSFWFRRPSVTQPMQYRFIDYLTHTPAKKLNEYRHRLDPADCLAQASMYVKNRYKQAA